MIWTLCIAAAAAAARAPPCCSSPPDHFHCNLDIAFSSSTNIMSSHSYRLNSSVPSCICCTKTNKQRTPLMRRWSTSKLNFSIQCPSYFLLFFFTSLSFFLGWGGGVLLQRNLEVQPPTYVKKTQRGRNFDLDIKPPTNRNKEKQQERERVRVRVRVWLFASFENVRKWAVSEQGSHCHGCCCCCYCSYGEDGSSNNTRATRTSTTEGPFVFCSSLCTQTAANSSVSVYVCVNFLFFFFSFLLEFWTNF